MPVGDAVTVPRALFAETFAKIGDLRATASALGMSYKAARQAEYRLRHEPPKAKAPRPLKNACPACDTPVTAKRKYCRSCTPYRPASAAELQAIEDAFNAGATHSQLTEMFGRSLGSICGFLNRARLAGRVGVHKPGRRPNV